MELWGDEFNIVDEKYKFEIAEINQALDYAKSLGRVTRQVEANNCAMLSNNAHQLLSEFYDMFNLATDEGSEDGASISPTEHKQLTKILNKLRSSISELTRAVNEGRTNA